MKSSFELLEGFEDKQESKDPELKYNDSVNMEVLFYRVGKKSNKLIGFKFRDQIYVISNNEYKVNLFIRSFTLFQKQGNARKNILRNRESYIHIRINESLLKV